MVFSKEEVEELNEIRDSFYNVLDKVDILRPSDDGEIRGYGRRVVLIDTESFAIPFELIGPTHDRIMRELGVKAGETVMENYLEGRSLRDKASLIFRVFRNGGFSLLKDLLKMEDVETNAEMLAVAAGKGWYGGWSHHGKILEVDEKEKKIVWQGKDTFESYSKYKTRSKTDKPSCSFLTGFLAGYQNVLWDTDKSVCRETKCRAKGDDYCEFEVSLEE